jgi:hypothetical protein
VKRGLFTSNAPSHHLALHHCPQLCSFLEYFGEGEKQKKNEKNKKELGKSIFERQPICLGIDSFDFSSPGIIFFFEAIYFNISWQYSLLLFALLEFLWELY